MQSKKKQQGTDSKMAARVIDSNGFWITVETVTEEEGDRLVGFIRHKKNTLTQRKDSTFRIDNRKVRIIQAKQQLWEFLIDAMAEYK